MEEGEKGKPRRKVGEAKGKGATACAGRRRENQTAFCDVIPDADDACGCSRGHCTWGMSDRADPEFLEAVI